MTALAPLEKTPLETYVPPAKPSLVGLSRAELAEQLGAMAEESVIEPHRRLKRTKMSDE